MKDKTPIIDYLMSLDSKPSYVKREIFDIRNEGSYLDIVMFGAYHIELHYDAKCADCALVEGGGAYGMEDLYYAADILDSRDEILDLWKLSNI